DGQPADALTLSGTPGGSVNAPLSGTGRQATQTFTVTNTGGSTSGVNSAIKPTLNQNGKAVPSPTQPKAGMIFDRWGNLVVEAGSEQGKMDTGAAAAQTRAKTIPVGGGSPVVIGSGASTGTAPQTRVGPCPPHMICRGDTVQSERARPMLYDSPGNDAAPTQLSTQKIPVGTGTPVIQGPGATTGIRTSTLPPGEYERTLPAGSPAKATPHLLTPMNNGASAPGTTARPPLTGQDGRPGQAADKGRIRVNFSNIPAGAIARTNNQNGAMPQQPVPRQTKAQPAPQAHPAPQPQPRHK